jgi:GAF domain-containing protein
MTARTSTDKGVSGLRLDSGPRSLEEVLNHVDSELLRLNAGPREVPVEDVVIFDSTTEQATGQAQIALAVGVSSPGPDVRELVESGPTLGISAFVFRTDEPTDTQLALLASELGVAVLSIPVTARWGHVYSLLITAITSDVHQEHDEGVPTGDLFALADAIASGVGGPVTIENHRGRVLAYANLTYEIDQPRRETILGRIPPLKWQNAAAEEGIAAALRSGDEIIRFDGIPEEEVAGRLVVPVRAGEELLGSIWVAEAGEPFDLAAERELERFAKVAAVHILSHRASADIRRRTRGAWVREVLEGRVPSGTGAMPRTASATYRVLVFTEAEQAFRDINVARILTLINLYLESRHPDSMCAQIGDQVWAVLPTMSTDSSESVRELAETILDRLETSLSVSLCAAIGTEVSTLGEVPSSKRAAEQALGVLKSGQTDGRVVDIDDFRAHAILLQIVDWAADKEELLEGKLQVLIAHDRRHGTPYELTLRTYLDLRGDIRRASAALSIHQNTLRHRLDRIIETAGFDLDDADERLVTELQLRMRARRGEPSRTKIPTED